MTTTKTTVAELQLEPIFSNLANDKEEVSPRYFIRHLIDRHQHTTESAKNVIYALIDMELIELTNHYTLKLIK